MKTKKISDPGGRCTSCKTHASYLYTITRGMVNNIVGRWCWGCVKKDIGISDKPKKPRKIVKRQKKEN